MRSCTRHLKVALKELSYNLVRTTRMRDETVLKYQDQWYKVGKVMPILTRTRSVCCKCQSTQTHRNQKKKKIYWFIQRLEGVGMG